jgi:type II secretory pathway component PulF
MSIFKYKARGGDGKIMTGLVEAPNQSTASRLLHDKQLFVVDLRENSDAFSFGGFNKQFNKVGFAEIVNFTRQLSQWLRRSVTTGITHYFAQSDCKYSICASGS